MKYSLGISHFLEEGSSLYHSVVFLYFFALIAEEGFLISSCYSLEQRGPGWHAGDAGTRGPAAAQCWSLAMQPLRALLPGAMSATSHAWRPWLHGKPSPRTSGLAQVIVEDLGGGVQGWISLKIIINKYK